MNAGSLVTICRSCNLNWDEPKAAWKGGFSYATPPPISKTETKAPPGC